VSRREAKRNGGNEAFETGRGRSENDVEQQGCIIIVIICDFDSEPSADRVDKKKLAVYKQSCKWHIFFEETRKETLLNNISMFLKRKKKKKKKKKLPPPSHTASNQDGGRQVAPPSGHLGGINMDHFFFFWFTFSLYPYIYVIRDICCLILRDAWFFLRGINMNHIFVLISILFLYIRKPVIAIHFNH
jgi:hypothetical protein